MLKVVGYGLEVESQICWLKIVGSRLELNDACSRLKAKGYHLNVLG